MIDLSWSTLFFPLLSCLPSSLLLPIIPSVINSEREKGKRFHWFDVPHSFTQNRPSIVTLLYLSFLRSINLTATMKWIEIIPVDLQSLLHFHLFPPTYSFHSPPLSPSSSFLLSQSNSTFSLLITRDFPSLIPSLIHRLQSDWACPSYSLLHFHTPLSPLPSLPLLSINCLSCQVAPEGTSEFLPLSLFRVRPGSRRELPESTVANDDRSIDSKGNGDLVRVKTRSTANWEIISIDLSEKRQGRREEEERRIGKMLSDENFQKLLYDLFCLWSGVQRHYDPPITDNAEQKAMKVR